MAERSRPHIKPSDSIYTVLVGIALVVLICGIGYVWFRNYQLTGSANPFQLQGSQASASVVATADDGHPV